MVADPSGWGATDRRVTWRLDVIALLALGCATSHVPQQLRRYDVVVEGKDEQSLELARAMREYGYHVRQRLRGGSRPTAALVYFTYSDPGPSQPAWLLVRPAATRTGPITASGPATLTSPPPPAA